MMQTTRFVVFQLADFLLFFFSGKYLNEVFARKEEHFLFLRELRKQYFVDISFKSTKLENKLNEFNRVKHNYLFLLTLVGF